MMSVHQGTTVEPPVQSLRPTTRSRRSPSRPGDRSGVKPMNHRSRLSLLVPVLPAIGRLSRFALWPVPFCTTPFRGWSRDTRVGRHRLAVGGDVSLQLLSRGARRVSGAVP